MASVTAVLPVPANANVAPSTAAKPADDDFHAVLASYAPARDHAAPRDVAKAAKGDASAPRRTKAQGAKDAKPDPIVRDGGSKGSKKTARDSEADAGDAHDSVQAQPIVIVAQQTTPAILRDATAMLPPVAANSDDVADIDTDNAFDTQAIAPQTSGSTDNVFGTQAIAPQTGGLAARTVTVNAPPRSPLLPSIGQNVSDDTKNSSAKNQNVDLPNAAARETQSVAVQNTPARALPQRAADAIAATVKNSTQLQTPTPTPQASVPAPQIMTPLQLQTPALMPQASVPAPQITTSLQLQTPAPTPQASVSAPQILTPLQSSVVTMLNAMRGAITVAFPAKQMPKAEAKLDVSPAKAAPAQQSTPNLAANVTNAALKSNAAVEDPIKSSAPTRIADWVADDSSNDDSTHQTAATAQIQLKPVPAAPSGATASKPDAAAPASGVTASKPDAAALASKADPHAIAQDSGVAAQNDRVTKVESSVSDKTVPLPVTTQQAAAAPQPSNSAVVAITPNVATGSTSMPSQVSVAAPSMHVPQEAAMQPNLAALATAIAAKSLSGTKTFDIRMDPPELGRVDVHLSVDRDGKVQAMLSAEHPQTLELLQRDSQHLERALKDSGLNLSNNSLNFSLKGEGRQGDGSGAFTARARSLPDTVVARAEAANASVSNFNFASSNGRLDIRV